MLFRCSNKKPHACVTVNVRKPPRKAGAKKPAALNPLRMDPSRTGALRQRISAELKRRFDRVKVDILKVMVDDDAFGLNPRDPFVFNAFCPTGKGGGIDPTCGSGSAAQGTGDLPRPVSIPTPKRFLGRLGAKGKALKEKAKAIYKKLEDRYGRAGASAIFISGQAISWGAFVAGGIIGQVIYIPSAVAMAPGAAVAEVVRGVKKRRSRKRATKAAVTANVAKLTREERMRLALEVLDELKQEAIRLGITDEPMTLNVFCPTGKGGGIDPTCSPNESKGSYANKIDLSGVKDADVRTRIESTLQELSDTYGVRLNGVKTIKMKADDSSDEASAALMTTLQTSRGGFRSGGPVETSNYLDLDEAVWADKASLKAYRDKLPNGYLADPSAAGMLRHEFAHALEKMHPEHDATISEIYKEYRKQGPTVSEYSVSSKREMVAEAFSHYHRQGSLEGTGLEKLASVFDSWKVTVNAFCPTGKGGGIDNSCGPDGSSQAGEAATEAPNKDDKKKPRKSKAAVSVGVTDPRTDEELRTHLGELRSTMGKLEDQIGLARATGQDIQVADLTQDFERVRSEAWKTDTVLYSRQKTRYALEGIKLTAEQVASAVGAPDDAKVTLLGTWQDKIEVNIQGARGQFSAKRTLERGPDGLIVHNDHFFINVGKGGGLGSAIFRDQVENMKELGGTRIETWAAKGSGMNGYYTWPRLGYDQQISEFRDKRTRDRISKAFPEAKSVLDIMATDEGRKWWKLNGTNMRKAKFDLREGSRSLKTLAAYMEERAARKPTANEQWPAFNAEEEPNEDDADPPAIEEAEEIEVDDDGEPSVSKSLLANVFCPTGPGGGIDPSCKAGGIGVGDKVSWQGKSGWTVKEQYGAERGGMVLIQKGTTSKVVNPTNLTKKGSEPQPKTAEQESLIKDGDTWIDERKFFGNAVTPLPEKAVQAGKSQLEKGRGAREYVDISSLTPTQDYTGADKVKVIAKEFDENQAIVQIVRMDGKNYIYDGHHTSAGAKLAGRDRVLARVISVNEQGIVANVGLWELLDERAKAKAFKEWLRSRVKVHLLSDEELWKRYAEYSWEKGMGRAYEEVKGKAALLASDDASVSIFEGSKKAFLNMAFQQPQSIAKLQALAARSFNDLEGVTEQMSTAITRTLVDGLAQGKGPRVIAREMAKQVDELGRMRAATIARTEIVRAHAEGQLDGMQALGVEEIGVMVEWKVTSPGKSAEKGGPCSLCRPLDGVTLMIDEARGLLPRHPNCRCAWIPANVGEDVDPAQKRSRRAIERAVKASVKQSSKGDTWTPGDISGTRPTRNEDMASVLTPTLYLLSPYITSNVFCPTGEGGGVDPTCKLGEHGSGGSGGAEGGGKKHDISLDSSNPKTLEVITKVFKGEVDLQTLAAASNAAPGSKTTVVVTPGGSGIQVTSQGPNGFAIRTFYRDGSKIVVQNNTFINKEVPGQPKRAGADLLHDQVKALQKLGVDRIETNAARDDKHDPPFVGYKVWPKLGYDGQIDDATFSKLPQPIRAAMGEKRGVLGIGGKKGERTLSKLYALPGGKEAWEKDGDSIMMTFDVKQGSDSMKKLEAYLAGRKPKPK